MLFIRKQTFCLPFFFRLAQTKSGGSCGLRCASDHGVCVRIWGLQSPPGLFLLVMGVDVVHTSQVGRRVPKCDVICKEMDSFSIQTCVFFGMQTINHCMFCQVCTFLAITSCMFHRSSCHRYKVR